MVRFGVPDGMVVQAFQFTLDLTGKQASMVRRQFGGRRYAYNWAVRTMRADITAFHADGAKAPVPSMIGLRKRWNQAKDTECVDGATGEAWWPEVSKEAFADGIAGAVDAYWNWQKSRAGTREGRRMGFPRFKRKGQERLALLEAHRADVTARLAEIRENLELIDHKIGVYRGRRGRRRRPAMGAQPPGGCPLTSPPAHARQVMLCWAGGGMDGTREMETYL